jgi:hypothetical protein
MTGPHSANQTVPMGRVIGIIIDLIDLTQTPL